MDDTTTDTEEVPLFPFEPSQESAYQLGRLMAQAEQNSNLCRVVDGLLEEAKTRCVELPAYLVALLDRIIENQRETDEMIEGLRNPPSDRPL